MVLPAEQHGLRPSDPLIRSAQAQLEPKIGKVIYGVHTSLKEHLLNPVEETRS
jgi:hypothetical protein